jgi:small basic protein (TIGR04137 family)
MSLDKSLKSKSALERHRNVLTRPERIEKLKEEGKWTEDSSPTGLPKVAHRKSTAGAKEKKEKKPAAEEEKASETPAGEAEKGS